MKCISSLLALTFFCSINLLAQPQVDIQLVYVPENGSLDIKLVPSGPFDGVFSNLQFTLQSDNPVTYDSLQQAFAESNYIPITAAGNPIQIAGKTYQKFTGFGLTNLASFRSSWIADEEIKVLNLKPSNFESTFYIVTDSLPADENGNFYIELNGEPKTGKINPTPVSNSPNLVSSSSFLIFPNPNTGKVQIAIQNPNQVGLYSLRLVSLIGQTLINQEIQFNQKGEYSLDMSSAPVGLYNLILSKGQNNYYHTIMRQ